MQDGQFSRTALMAAAARAAHLVVDAAPFLFEDPLAATLLGEQADELIGYHRLHGDHLVLSGTRLLTTVRARYTENRLAEQGPEQYVILGAGLDSHAHRAGPGGPRVFEVDHPAAQGWKRARLASAGIAPPPGLTYVGVDLEREPFLPALVEQGFDPSRPALVGWLAVSMYLTREAIDAVLAAVGGLAPGTELVLDHVLPPELRDADGNAYADVVMPAAAERGEPWLTFLTPDETSALLDEHGLRVAEHLRYQDAVAPALWERTDALRPFDLMRLVRATV